MSMSEGRLEGGGEDRCQGEREEVVDKGGAGRCL